MYVQGFGIIGQIFYTLNGFNEAFEDYKFLTLKDYCYLEYSGFCAVFFYLSKMMETIINMLQ